jgi:hypothetical protein
MATLKEWSRQMKTILTKKQFAERAGVSVRHLERLFAAGEGPPIVQLCGAACKSRPPEGVIGVQKSAIS